LANAAFGDKSVKDLPGLNLDDEDPSKSLAKAAPEMLDLLEYLAKRFAEAEAAFDGLGESKHSRAMSERVMALVKKAKGASSKKQQFLYARDEKGRWLKVKNESVARARSTSPLE
jgi:hypothetical protein